MSDRKRIGGRRLACLLLLEAILFTVPGAADETRVLSAGPEAGELETALEQAWHWKQEGMDVEVILEPGVYTKPIRVSGDRAGADGPEPEPGWLTLKAESPGTATFSEAVRLEDWEQLNFRTWVHPFALDTPDDGRVALFYDRAWLTQRDRRNQLEVWNVFIATDRKLLYLAVPEDAPWDPGKIRLARRDPCPLLHLEGVRKIRLEGLVFEYDFSSGRKARAAGPFIGDCREIVLEDCRFLQNERGIEIQDTIGVYMRNCEVAGSGFQGVLTRDTAGLVLVGTTLRHNGNLADTGGGGAFDFANFACRNPLGKVSISRSRISDGYAGLVFLGLNASDIVLSDLVVGYHEDAGFHFSGDALNICLRNSRVGRNQGAALRLSAQRTRGGGPELTVDGTIFFAGSGGPLLDLEAGSVNLSGCILESRSAEQPAIRVADGTAYAGSGNLWWHAAAPGTAFNGADWDAWTAKEGRETGSRFADPLFLDTENLDFDIDFESPWFRPKGE